MVTRTVGILLALPTLGLLTATRALERFGATVRVV